MQPNQEQTLINVLGRYSANPGVYSLSGRNCTTVAESVLKAVGVIDKAANVSNSYGIVSLASFGAYLSIIYYPITFTVKQIKMKTLINMALVLMLLFVSCKGQKHNEIDTLLKSAEASDIILGNFLIGEAHDSSYVKQLLCNTDDSRISHDVRFKGISVYQSKMIALKKISNIQPPRLITYEPDTLIVNFYKDWAAKKNLNKLQ